MSESKIHTLTCRNCGHSLEFEDGQTSVYCGYCDTQNHIDAPVAPKAEVVQNTTVNVNVKSPEAGLRYLKAYIKGHDLSFFFDNPYLIHIDELVDSANTLKIDCGNDPKAWEYSIRAVTMPLIEKVDFLVGMERRFEEDVRRGDEDMLLNDFDLYAESVRVLKEALPALRKTLEADLDGYAECGGDKDNLQPAIDEAIEVIESLEPYEKPEDCDRVKVALDERNEEIAEELALNGISAASEYDSAIAAIDRGDIVDALVHLQHLGDYKDAKELRKKHSNYHTLGKLLYLNKKYYYLAEENALALLNDAQKTKKRGKDEDEGQNLIATRALQVRKIKDGKPDYDAEPIVKDIARILDAYGPFLYYLGNDRKLRYHNFDTGTGGILDEGGEYYFDTWVKDPSRGLDYFSMRRRIAAEGKKPDPADSYNGLSLVRLNLAKGGNAFEIVIPAYERIVYRKGDYVGYWLTAQDPTEKRGCALFRVPPTFHKEYHLLRLSTGEGKVLLSYEDEIVFVEGSRIYFTRHAHSKFNLSLHYVDFDSGASERLLDNVYNAIMVDKGYLYYTIGNTYSQTLYRYHLQSGERKEIMAHFGGLVDCFGGYFYLYRGVGNNRALIKMRMDGEGKPIALAFGRGLSDFRFVDGYLFYMEENPSSPFDGKWLHKVRIDGKNDVTLSGEVRKLLLVKDGRLYFSQSEYVEQEFGMYGAVKNVPGLSLYSFDVRGENLRKELFDFSSVKANDDGTLLYLEEEEARYTFHLGKQNKKGQESILNRVLEHYRTRDLLTGEEEEILTVGEPSGVEKTGCFRKKEKPIEYKRVPIKRPYSKEGMN